MVHFRLRQSIIDKFKTGEYGKPVYQSMLSEIRSKMSPPPPKWYDIISKPEPIKLRPIEELRRIGIIRDDPKKNLNLMSDPRVIRGSKVRSKVQEPDKRGSSGGKHRKRYSDAQTNVLKAPKRVQQNIATPRPVDGRENLRVQTDDHVERLRADYELFFEDVSVQTIPLHSFPPEKTYVVPVVENCKETQVDDSTKFFNIAEKHKEPLKNLCHKIVDRCLYELMDKYERDIIAKSSEKIQPTIAALQKRIEEIQMRENCTRKENNRFDVEQQQFFSERTFVSRIGEGLFTRSIMNDMTLDTINDLKQKGHLDDPLKVAVRDELIPWLNSYVQRYFTILHDSRDILDEMVIRVGETRNAEYCCTDHDVVDGEVIYANQYELLKRDKHLTRFCEQIITKVEERDEFIQSVYNEVALRKEKIQKQRLSSGSETGGFSTHD